MSAMNTLKLFVIEALPSVAAMLFQAKSPLRELRMKLDAEALAAVKAVPYGFDEEGMDTSVSSGNDFYTYANGHYLATTPIPPDETRWGFFDILAETSLTRVRAILEEDAGKLGSFYKSFMNQSAILSKGLEPIQMALDEINTIHDVTAFSRLAGKGVYTIEPTPFSLIVDIDRNDPFKYSLCLSAAGLGLPTRDYYLIKSKDSFKEAYKSYVTRVLEMLRFPHPEQAGDDVVALEEGFANVHWPLEDLRDPLKTNNLRTQAQLMEAAPGFDWAAFFDQSENLSGRNVVVSDPSAVTGMAQLIGKTRVSVLQAWSMVHTFNSVAPYLPESFAALHFEFYGKTLGGQQEERPRWKRGVSLVNGYMGDAVGEVFVQRHFPPEAKEAVEALTLQLKGAFQTRLTKLSWMTNVTKGKALEKLKTLDIQVGYPKKFKSYHNLDIVDDDLLGNVERSIRNTWRIDLARLGQPVDRDEWFMTPQEINAYNMQQFNQIVFPAAILQPPFFNTAADPAVNFGAIGAIIGHEMTHSFDDAGRHYDEHGALIDWWASEDEAEFNARAERYGEQFSAFDLGPDANGYHINAKLTLGEDIADLGGLLLAFDAYNLSRDMRNLTLFNMQEGNRRVFLGWAQVWRELERPESLQMSLASDPHPPAKARVNIPTRNIDAWYEAFSVDAGCSAYLAPQQRVTIW